VAAAESDANGDYEFEGYTAGDYEVLFHIPENMDATIATGGIQPVTVVAGETAFEINAGAKPPAPPPAATGKRDGIDWGTLDWTSGQASVGPDGVKGKLYTVKTATGDNNLEVFKSDPAATQPANLLPLGWEIDYNCHGFSLNLRGIADAKGGLHSFAIVNENSPNTVVSDEYDARSPVQAKADLAAGKRVVMFFNNGQGGVIHSVLLTTVVTKADGSLDKDKSMCDSKNGWNQLATGMGVTVQSVWSKYALTNDNTIYILK